MRLQVHSLTARSVSRSFREGLKQAQPQDINIKLKPSIISISEKETNKEFTITEINDNYNSKDDFTDDCENNEDTLNNDTETNPGELNRKKGGSSSNILARAAFWDKRVNEGIIDDELVIKEFPKMEI